MKKPPIGKAFGLLSTGFFRTLAPVLRACLKMSALIVVLLTAVVTPADVLKLSGKVVSPEEKPVGEATVWLGQGWQIRKTVTNSEGKFSFDKVETGDASVVAAKEGWSLGGCTPFVIENVEVLVTLGLPQSMTLRVINAEMLPAPGARIVSMWVSGQFFVPVEGLLAHGFPPLRSGDDGVLEIPALPVKGFVKLVLSHPKYADTVVPYLPVAGKRQDIILYPGITVRGRVTYQGKGVRNALVSVFRPGVGNDQSGADTVTDPDGIYHVRVKQGEYQVGVRHPDYASPSTQPVAPGDPDQEYTVDLEMLTPKVISGSVRLPGGKPAIAVRVLFRTKEGVVADAFTGADGAFRLNVAVDTGLINLVPPPGFMTESLPDVPVALEGRDRAQLPPIRLKELPAITGEVRFEDGQPAASVLISSLNLEVPAWAITNEQGKFELRLNFMPEQRKALFRAEHAVRLLRQDFSVDLGAAKPAKVKLEPFMADQSHRPATPGKNNLGPLLDKPAPEIRCSDWVNSVPLTLESLRGKVVVLTFWGGFDESPLGISRMEELRALHDLYRGVDDVAVVAVHDHSIDWSEVENYVQTLRLRFPVGRDAEPFVTFVNYNVNFIPQTVIIDKEGILRYFEVEGRIPELIKALRRAGV